MDLRERKEYEDPENCRNVWGALTFLLLKKCYYRDHSKEYTIRKTLITLMLADKCI